MIIFCKNHSSFFSADHYFTGANAFRLILDELTSLLVSEGSECRGEEVMETDETHASDDKVSNSENNTQSNCFFYSLVLVPQVWRSRNVQSTRQHSLLGSNCFQRSPKSAELFI